jgi:hypothetical protein
LKLRSDIKDKVNNAVGCEGKPGGYFGQEKNNYMDTLMQTSLEIGHECWMEHYKGTYQGMKDGKHVVRVEGKSKVTENQISYMPVPDDGWRPTETYKYRNQFLRFSGKIYCWMREGNLKFYYGLKSSATFGDGETLAREVIEKLETVSDDNFLGEEAINDLIYDVDKKIVPLRNQVNELNAQINNLEKEKVPIYAKCFHDWDKQEEEQYGRNQSSYRQMCVCKNCGKEEYSYFSKF